MLLLLAVNLVIMAGSLLTIFSGNMFLFIIVGLILILVFGTLFWTGKMKKKEIHEVVHPITDYIGNLSERVAELNDELEPFGFAYEPYQDIFYSLQYPWQRELGYCKLYDEASATMSMIIDCEPICFKYNGKKWLIEFWKGQYGMTTGGEVGIYYTSGSELDIPGLFSGTFYYSVKDEDRMNISFAFRKKGNLLFTRSGYHWWLTGFKLGEFSKPSELTMDIVIDMYDRQMVKAFIDALVKAGYKENEYSVQGRRVFIHFAKPHSPQPSTRTRLTDFIMLKNDEAFCNAYNYLTEDYSDTLDKLEIVRQESPNMYDHILNLGKPKAVYAAYEYMKGFINKGDG